MSREPICVCCGCKPTTCTHIAVQFGTPQDPDLQWQGLDTTCEIDPTPLRQCDCPSPSREAEYEGEIEITACEAFAILP